MKLLRPINPALARPFDIFKLGEKMAAWERRERKLWAGAGDRTYAIDANMILSDGAAAYTASGFAQNLGANGVVDLGGNQNVTITLPAIADVTTLTPQQARIDAVCVIDMTAIATGGTDLYKVLLLLSNDPAFGAGNVAMGGMLEFGAAASLDTPNGFVTPQPNAIGGSRYEMPFTSEQNNVKYEYCALYNVISGNTSPSITYKAFVAVLPEP
jgi:hypothetical protein